MQQLNLTAFDTPVTRQERRAEIKAFAKTSKQLLITLGIVSAIVLVIMYLLATSFVSSGRPILVLIPLAFVLMFVVATIGFVYAGASERARLRRFAADNDMEFISNAARVDDLVAANHAAVGAIFDVGDRRSFDKGFRRKDGVLVVNYRYTLGSGKNSTTYYWGVLRHKLPRRLPNVILDAKSNNSIFGSNLPNSYSGSQVLELEGDFNDYFRVLVPEGYGRDALYFLTPELMAHLVDYGKAYDFEIVDDYLYVYVQKSFDFTKDTLPNLFQTIDFFAYQFDDNVKRYADERVPNARTVNVVGTQGTRLKKRFAWVGIVFFIIFILLQLLPNILSFFLGNSH